MKKPRIDTHLSLKNTHDENFPVASFLLPKHLHQPIALIYSFARQADDVADEGDLTAAQRLALLAEFAAELQCVKKNQVPETALFKALQGVITQYNLPITAFESLLSAFTQDVYAKPYAHFTELQDYCTRSANPVGRLMLTLFGAHSAKNIAYSDAICTGLQLINFLQDVKIDLQKNRVYFCADELAQFNVTKTQLSRPQADAQVKALIAFNVARAQQLMLEGAPLVRSLSGRIGFEMRLIIAGGLRILAKIKAQDYDVLQHRPILTKRDYVLMLMRSLTL